MDNQQNEDAPSSRLTEEDKKKIDTWLRQKLKGQVKACPLCGASQWVLYPDFLAPLPWFRGATKGKVLFGQSQFPHFGLACQNCGNTQLVNAIAAGVVPADDSG